MYNMQIKLLKKKEELILTWLGGYVVLKKSENTISEGFRCVEKIELWKLVKLN